MNSSLRDEVIAWIALDPDENDRHTLQVLLDADDEAELERRFATPLTFGTAGLRGPEMAGPAGMNRALRPLKSSHGHRLGWRRSEPTFSPGAGRRADIFLEGSVEGGFRFVADL